MRQCSCRFNYCYLQQSLWSHDFHDFLHIPTAKLLQAVSLFLDDHPIILYFTVIYSSSSRVPCNLYLIWSDFEKLDLVNFACASNISNGQKNNRKASE